MTLESATSFVSRLAASKGALSTADYCVDVGLRYSDLRLGRADAIDRLAELGDVDREVLERQSCVRLEQPDVRFLNVTFPLNAVDLSRVRLCPACLRADSGPDDPRSLRMYGRLTWLLVSFRVCPVHCVRLVDFPRKLGRGQLDHFGEVSAHRRKLQEGELDVPVASEPLLERHILARLTGEETDDWLKHLPIHAVARLSEILGAAIVFGRDGMLGRLTDDDFLRCAQEGFSSLAKGPDGIEEVFRNMRSVPGKAQDGPQARYGILHRWFTGDQGRRPEYDRVRHLFSEHILNFWSMKPGSTVLGREVHETRVYTVAAAAEHWGIPARKLRKAIAAKGLVAPAGSPELDLIETFPAEAAREILDGLADSLSRPEAMAKLGISQLQLKGLEDSGLLPAVRPGPNVKPRHARASVEDLLHHLQARVRGTVSPYDSTWRSLAEVINRTKMSLPHLLAAILNGQIAELRSVPSEPGISSLRLRLADARAIRTAIPENGRPSRRAVSERLRTGETIIMWLSEQGYLQCVKTVIPGTRLPKWSFDPDTVEHFDRTFVNINKMALEWGLPKHAVSKLLREYELAPDLVNPSRHARFWRRDALAMIDPSVSNGHV